MRKRIENRSASALEATQVEIFEAPHEMLICVDLPRASLIQARLEDDDRVLGIHVSCEGEDWHAAVPVPAYVDPTNSTATFENGVLAIRLPKGDDPEDPTPAPLLN